MPAASTEYIALSESLARNGMCLGLTIGPKLSGGRGRKQRRLDALTVRKLKDTQVLMVEPVMAGDCNEAAGRLLKRLGKDLA